VRSKLADRNTKLTNRVVGGIRGHQARAAAAAQPVSSAQKKRKEPAGAHKRKTAARRTVAVSDDDEESSGDGSSSSGSSSEFSCGVHCITARRQVLGEWQYKGQLICKAQVLRVSQQSRRGSPAPSVGRSFSDRLCSLR
jgi:hypothetical protein